MLWDKAVVRCIGDIGDVVTARTEATTHWQYNSQRSSHLSWMFLWVCVSLLAHGWVLLRTLVPSITCAGIDVLSDRQLGAVLRWLGIRSSFVKSRWREVCCNICFFWTFLLKGDSFFLCVMNILGSCRFLSRLPWSCLRSVCRGEVCIKDIYIYIYTIYIYYIYYIYIYYIYIYYIYILYIYYIYTIYILYIYILDIYMYTIYILYIYTIYIYTIYILYIYIYYIYTIYILYIYYIFIYILYIYILYIYYIYILYTYIYYIYIYIYDIIIPLDHCLLEVLTSAIWKCTHQPLLDHPPSIHLNQPISPWKNGRLIMIEVWLCFAGGKSPRLMVKYH